jgi:hypothetical protein
MQQHYHHEAQPNAEKQSIRVDCEEQDVGLVSMLLLLAYAVPTGDNGRH